MNRPFNRTGQVQVIPSRGRTPMWCAVVCSAALLATGGADARHSGEAPPSYTPGAPGLGDPYYPQDGNGGYDALHYALKVDYEPATDELTGRAAMRAEATQNLSSFNLDLDGLTVDSVEVDGAKAAFKRAGSELTVIPAVGIDDGESFESVITYHGVPKTIEDALGSSGFFHTDDGAIVAGQPHGASTWFPVNDHPLDPASYTFDVTVPEGLQVVANGRLADEETVNGRNRWVWEAEEPMASYLSTINVGKFDVDEYLADGLQFVDAYDPDLFTPLAAHGGQQFASAQAGDVAYKRLTRTIAVPAGGAELSFWVNRELQRNRDFAFVEARTARRQNWTTLPDQNGHTSTATGRFCQDLLGLHPFLKHYQSVKPDGTCAPKGSSGTWNAATFVSETWEQWKVDLSAYAGSDVELSITYASDAKVAYNGLFIDDIAVSTREGSTSFEDDGDTWAGWTAARPPAGSPEIEGSWTATDEPPPTVGARTEASLAREPEILRFLEGYFGDYPFRDTGGIVDDLAGLGFALENQTRPVYAKDFFYAQPLADGVVVHELAHQWYGDSVAVADWREIWLNEGFASYAEWLWSEKEGLDTAQQLFDERAAIPAAAPFWKVVIGDPGAAALFDEAVYERGAMAVHALRQAVGDDDFFTILRRWPAERAGGNATIGEFIAFAEDVSGEDLTPLFDVWLYTPEKPGVLAEVKAGAVWSPPFP
jgi:hypothetical protein